MKKLWKQNRVILMLLIILAVCFVAIVVVAFSFFYSRDVDSYGSRLDGIDKHKITDKFKTEYKETVLESEHITKVSMNIKGRIIYVHINCDNEIELDDAKKVVVSSLELFDEDIISYYDIDFILSSDNFTIIGAKNAINEELTWNNNRAVDEEEEDKDEE